MTWVFIVVFPILMGSGPVPISIPGVDRAHCEKLREFFTAQLDRHRSNAVVTKECVPAAPVLVPKEELKP